MWNTDWLESVWSTDWLERVRRTDWLESVWSTDCPKNPPRFLSVAEEEGGDVPLWERRGVGGGRVRGGGRGGSVGGDVRVEEGPGEEGS